MIFHFDPKNPSALEPVETRRLKELHLVEKDIENLVRDRIELIVRADNLFVIHQERRLQEEPDIMALDQDANLHIFELKRGRGQEENILQILRYGQKFGRYGYDELEHLFQQYANAGGGQLIPDLDKAHQEYFYLPEPLPKTAFNPSQRFVVMTEGLDHNSRDAIDYWRRQGIAISPLIYAIYQIEDGKFLLEVKGYGPEYDAFGVEHEGLVVVNTNSSYRPDAWRDMLDEEKASAYLDKKTAVMNVPKRSRIALYHNRAGIIAFGKTIGTYRKRPCDGQDDGEYYLPCRFETKIDGTQQPDPSSATRSMP